MNRRSFFKQGIAATGTYLGLQALASDKKKPANYQPNPTYRFLNKSLFTAPVILESLDLFRIDKNWFVRARSTDGAEGWAISHNNRMNSVYSSFVRDVAPYFIGKDVRNIEALLDGVFAYKGNYKMQGQGFWVCVASAEFAMLDMLGRIVELPVAELLGGVRQKFVKLYVANNHREHDVEESLRLIVNNVDSGNFKAVKHKIGGRMRLLDTFPGRTERLIPAVADALGDRCTLYADSNSSYVKAKDAIRVGKLLQSNGYTMYEEPTVFDDLWSLKKVADELDIIIAGGEQESSFTRFEWMIRNGAVQLSQPDLFYYGGLIRSLRVAKLSQECGIKCTPHISGGGMGFLYMLVFASCAPAIGPFQEYKGVNQSIPWESPGVDFKVTNGVIPAPTGPGMGVNYNPEFLRKGRLIDSSFLP